MTTRAPRVLAVSGLTVAALLTAAPPPAHAASRDGHCDAGEFCYYYNSDNQGSISDFTGSVSDYGTSQPECYEFKGAGNGQGKCIKNNAASVWNRRSTSVRVYYNSYYGGAYQTFAGGAKQDLNSTLLLQNASHKYF